MYIFFKNIHHYVAMITLVFILLLTVVSFIYFLQGRTITGQVKKISILTIIFTHTQVLIGMILFFSSSIFHNASMKEIMGNGGLRRTYVEHPFSMIIAAVLLTIVNYQLKKVPRITVGILVMSAISLALVIGMIPRIFWTTLISY